MIVMSIDLGVTGAYAIHHPEHGCTHIVDLPVAASRITAGALATDLIEHDVTHVVTERVHAMGQNGSKANFSMGHHLGVITGIAASLSRPLHEIAPTTWKRQVALGSGADKDAARELAARLYPDHAEMFRRKKDHNRAEAVLIGRAWLEMEKGTPAA